MLVTSFRMYSAGPGAAAAWKALFTRAFADTRLDVSIIEHAFPKPIDALWSEPALFGAFMCGWPYARDRSGMQAIVAPVPSPPRYQSLPRYCSDYVVRAASGWTRLEDTFGHRFGWMARNSQSGFNAPRAHLATLATQGEPLFSEVKGPLGNPAQSLRALRAGEIDVVALDGFYLDLARHHEPASLQDLRVVGSTPWTPIPLLVAAPGVDARSVAILRDHLLAVDEIAAYRPLLAGVLLERFAAPDLDSYTSLETMAEEAEQSGYAVIR